MTPKQKLTTLPVQQHASNLATLTATSRVIVADTGATGNFFEGEQDNNDESDQHVHVDLPLTNIKATNKGISVLLPNNTTIKSTHTAELDIPQLPANAKKTHIFPHLASGSLLSIGQLCDAGCTALFETHKLYIFHNGKIILQGTRQPSKLWTIDLPTAHSLNSVIDAPTIAERINFNHRSLFCPTLSTLTAAIKAGYLQSFPVITPQQLRR